MTEFHLIITEVFVLKLKSKTGIGGGYALAANAIETGILSNPSPIIFVAEYLNL